MPSIAQQDYLRPRGKSLNDCHLFAALAHNLEQNTIFDTIISYISGDNEELNARVIAAYFNKPSGLIVLFDIYDGSLVTMEFRYTQTQYEGLAAIQDAQNNYGVIPDLENVGTLLESNTGNDITTNGYHKIIPTVEGGKLKSLSISPETQSDPTVCAEISWEDAQKLIGLPVS